ncbi:hypothetical protein CC85DRAFT_288259 [Cutaneotrichosporon oleaginosum]|uniref:Cora-domain-containing protein n=1 Tax=Cutaneotrichosporon oleaginosum TaxID=879819 RepID=A0A0J1AWM1_9TREE|nr:uncharacterized protein CC85DRAFT_288259 [Cutaneotrichosporon oleaginosum]KLT39689.1 hypothetical protein CC85DRAFT_288259 [Cutaneotrichosporon oleaginosum]
MPSRPELVLNRPSFTASPPPMTGSPADSPGTDGTTPRQYFRRESLAVAGARRSSFYNSYSPSSPIAVAPRRRSGSGSFGSVPSASSFSARPERLGTAGFGVSFRNAFAAPLDEETIQETSSGEVSPGSTSPRGHRPGAHSRSMPVPRRRRSSTIGQIHWLPGGAGGETGDEPGVDVRSARDQEAYGHLKAPTAITVIDYSSDPDAEDTNIRVDFPGTKLSSWLNSAAGQRPIGDDRKPLGVRWIHVTGLNWEVMKTLTLRYQLHPLAVEDALRSSRSPRSKIDYYRTHMYLQILVHHIHGPDKDALEKATVGLAEGEDGRQCCDDADHDHDHRVDDIEAVMPKKQRWWHRNPEGQIRLPEGVDAVFGPTMPGQARRKKGEDGKCEPSEVDMTETHRLVVDQLSASYMVPIRKGIISAFMMRDGLIITMCESDMSEALEPIYERLEDEHSLLRRSGDVSMLAQALVDVTVDLSIEIAQAFEAEILKAESQVLVSPQLEFVRRLFIVQAQITRFRRQLTPLLYACYIIRDQDTARSAAAGELTLPRRHRSNSTATAASLSAMGAGSGQQSSMGLGPSQGVSPHLAAGPQGIPNIHGLHGGNAAVPGFAIPGLAPAGAGTAGGLSGLGGMGLPSVPNVAIPGSGAGADMPPADIPEEGEWTPSREGSGPAGAATPTPVQNPTAAANAATALAVGAGHHSAPGYFSLLSKVYMNDVIDHLEMVVGSSEQFVSTCDHLTDYVFNVLSFQTNNSMERLSIVTVIFLPLTFISSYFGMNFTDFPALETDVWNGFWKYAAPLTIAFFVIFSFSYIQTGWDTLRRRAERRQRERDIGRRRFSYEKL